MSWALIERIMRLSKFDFIVLALAILGSITTLGEASEMKGLLSQDAIIQFEIYHVIGAQQTAWNRGDIDAFMNGYARSNSTTFVSEDKGHSRLANRARSLQEKIFRPRQDGRTHVFRSRNYAVEPRFRCGPRQLEIKTRS
jgi:hypothetical protein